MLLKPAWRVQDKVPQPPADELAGLAELHAARKVYLAQQTAEARKVWGLLHRLHVGLMIKQQCLCFDLHIGGCH